MHCDLCDDEGTITCERCNGSGEGMADGSTCQTCHGSGEVPCECVAQARDDAKSAAEEAKYDARRDGE
jgi:DnaJ-class molecular chaperone